MGITRPASVTGTTVVTAEQNVLNIILFGESGVGKSTFINSFANYFQYDTFEDALQNPLTILIPARINVTDVKGESHEFIAGATRAGEVLEVGSSRTQKIFTYLFPIEGCDYKIKLIDTPGLGDSRGVEKDDENCETILNYLQKVDELHAICILMSPKINTMSPAVVYCLRQILSRLDKSACDNLIFVFTSSRSEDYSPGETLPILKKMIAEINKSASVNITVNKNSLFSIDNESFKYALAIQKGIEISTFAKRGCKKSWEVSKNRCFGLVQYVRDLQPHDVKSTVSLNQARKFIDEFSKPLSDISQLLQRNIQALEERKKELNETTVTVNELRSKLNIPVVDLDVKKLDHSILVCTSSSCVRKIKVNGITKIDYIRRCHDPCPLVGHMFVETVGHFGIFFCAQMTWAGTCQICECSYRTHMSVFYETNLVNKVIINEDVQDKLVDEESVRKEISSQIKNMELRKRELEEEHGFMSNCAAKFAVFLKRNAITPHCDAYREYIELSIQRERTLGEDADFELIEKLNEMKRHHEELKKILELSDWSHDEEITAEGVQNDIKQLYKLKHFGAKFREICDKRASCVDRAVESSYASTIAKAIKRNFWLPSNK